MLSYRVTTVLLTIFPTLYSGVSSLWAADCYLLSDLQQHQMRNKVHNRCNVHRSARNQPPLVCEKVSSVKPVPGARKVGDHCLHPWLIYFIAGSLFCSYPEACLFVCLRVIFVVSWRLVWCGAKSLVVLGLRSMQASIVAARRLSCSAACRILVSHQGIKPECLALPGRFLTTGLPGKSLPWGFYICIYIYTYI